VQAFFAPGRMGRPVLSPDGRHVAVQAPRADGRIGLVVLELNPPRQARVVAGFADADVRDTQWVNNRRLVFTVADLAAEVADQRAPGLFAVDIDGQDMRQLIARRWHFLRSTRPAPNEALEPYHRLLRTLRDGSDDVIVERANLDSARREVRDTTPLRVDTRSGRSRVAVGPGWPDGAMGWVMDERGQARMVVAREAGRTRVHRRAAPDAPWKQVLDVPSYGDGSGGGYRPVQWGPDGILYATRLRDDAARTQALYRFDTATDTLEPMPLVAVAGFDFDGQLLFDHTSGKLIGLKVTSDAVGMHWLDEGMKRIQAQVDAKLGQTVNLLDVAECACSRWVLVTAYSDRQPAIYLLYDRERDALEVLGTSRPDIDPRRMAAQDLVRVRARDGLEFPLYVTKPAGRGPWPAVVLVHGGPYVRGRSWHWSADAQFLASRGYLVLEPEYRGSTGYGQGLFQAGWRQWGLAMQDDIADTAKWAVAQGLADPARICIAGASYGGYATLMGLVRHPDLYRCGIAWAAVTDIGLLYDLTWSDLPEEWMRHGMPRLIADPVRDAAQIEATSPLKQAARIRRPLLLAFGGVDRRVPIDHGRKLRDALAAQNADVQWVEYPGEGHGWSKPENRYDFWGRVEVFLRRNLGAPTPAPAASTPR
jgi:dipeptidyl aminopeptidase/acylaminoacyl peptidase